MLLSFDRRYEEPLPFPTTAAKRNTESTRACTTNGAYCQPKALLCRMFGKSIVRDNSHNSLKTLGVRCWGRAHSLLSSCSTRGHGVGSSTYARVYPPFPCCIGYVTGYTTAAANGPPQQQQAHKLATSVMIKDGHGETQL